VDQTRLHRGLREDGFDRLGEPGQAVDARDQDVADAARLEVVEDLHPELGALGLLEPHAEDVAVALERDAQSEIQGAALHAAAVTDLQHHAVQEHDRVDVLQRPLRPLADVVHDGVGHAADQVEADLDAVDLLQVRADVAHRQAARIQRQDLVVEADEPPLALLDDPGLEAPVTVARRVERDLAVLGDQRLRRRPVPSVPGPARRLLVRLEPEMVGQLDLHRPLHQPLRQLREQPAGPSDLLLAARPREQLVDHLVADPPIRRHPESLPHPPAARNPSNRIVDKLPAQPTIVAAPAQAADDAPRGRRHLA